MAKKFKTKITEMLGIEYPILCGGMQWVSRAPFVSTVCNAGGLGFITAESLEKPADLREEIKIMRDLTDKPFGINLSMIPEFGLPERTLRFCDVLCEEGVKIVETAGRGPEPLMPVLKQGHLVRARRGAGGGYRLARPASEITIAEVVRLMDGPLAPTESASHFFFSHTPLEKEKRPAFRLSVFRTRR